MPTLPIPAFRMDEYCRLDTEDGREERAIYFPLLSSPLLSSPPLRILQYPCLDFLELIINISFLVPEKKAFFGR